MLLVQVEDDLGVRARPEPVTGCFEARAVFRVIVDLTVRGEPDRPVLVGHWLATVLDVDEAQPPVGQSHAFGEVDPFTIRSAVPDRAGHSLQHRLVDATRRLQRDDARDPAHPLRCLHPHACRTSVDRPDRGALAGARPSGAHRGGRLLSVSPVHEALPRDPCQPGPSYLRRLPQRVSAQPTRVRSTSDS